jgi:hyperosmotically inducible periplasmic protein
MKNRNLRQILIVAGILLLASLTQISMASIPGASKASQQTRSLQENVQHALRMLPYYGVFDEIRFSVDGDTVTLAGEVVRPILKSDAEHAVANVAGVKKVVNDLEILPLSPADDALRLRLYRAVYLQPGFERYAIQAVQPIRIIVRNGDVKLIGVVGSPLDRALAGAAARNVPFAFSVTNDLAIG